MLANHATSGNWKKTINAWHACGLLWLQKIEKKKLKNEKSNWFKIADFYPWLLANRQLMKPQWQNVNCFKDRTTTTSRSVKTVCPPDLEVGRVVCDLPTHVGYWHFVEYLMQTLALFCQPTKQASKHVSKLVCQWQITCLCRYAVSCLTLFVKQSTPHSTLLLKYHIGGNDQKKLPWHTLPLPPQTPYLFAHSTH